MMMMMTTRKLLVQVQARLGAMDRVLGALTHRGIIPASFCGTTENDITTIEAEFECDNDQVMRKLCKHLDRQIYILNVCDASEKPVCLPLGISIPSYPKAGSASVPSAVALEDSILNPSVSA